MDPLAIARYGMLAAEQRFDASAQRVASGSDTLDLAHETIETAEAKQAFKASVAVVKIADEMWRSLLDIQTDDRR